MSGSRQEGYEGGYEVTADGHGNWVVLLEAAPNGEASLLDIGTARVILRSMGDKDGVVLHAPDRVALQLKVRADDVALALGVALTGWRTAAATSVPAGWDVVRAEVLSPEEFKRDCESS